MNYATILCGLLAVTASGQSHITNENMLAMGPDKWAEYSSNVMKSGPAVQIEIKAYAEYASAAHARNVEILKRPEDKAIARQLLSVENDVRNLNKHPQVSENELESDLKALDAYREEAVFFLLEPSKAIKRHSSTSAKVLRRIRRLKPRWRSVMMRDYQKIMGSRKKMDSEAYSQVLGFFQDALSYLIDP